MSCRSFKPAIFFTLPVNGIVLALACTSFITEKWVSGEARYTDATDITSTTVFNFGLFHGSKTVKLATSTKFSDLTLVCSSGKCMYSCAGDRKKEDIEDVLSACPASVAAGDLTYCQDQDLDLEDQCATENTQDLMRRSTLVAGIIFLIVAIALTVISSIFGIINAFSNPIQTIVSVYGLVLWNGLAAVAYFFLIAIYGGEFHHNISKVAPISQVVRGDDQLDFQSEGETHLDYSYWLILVCCILHLANEGLVLYFIFGVLRRKQKVVKIAYESGPDNVILF